MERIYFMNRAELASLKKQQIALDIKRLFVLSKIGNQICFYLVGER